MPAAPPQPPPSSRRPAVVRGLALWATAGLVLSAALARASQDPPVAAPQSGVEGPAATVPGAPAWIADPIAEWPRIVLSNRAEFRVSSELRGGAAFLGRRPDGRVVAVTSSHLLGVEHGVVPAVRVPELPLQTSSWTLHTAAAGDADPEPLIELGAIASAGFDHWSSGVLMLQLASSDADTRGAALTDEPPAVGPPAPASDEPQAAALELPAEVLELPAEVLELRGAPAAAEERLTLIVPGDGPDGTLRTIAGTVFSLQDAGWFEFQPADRVALSPDWLGAPLIDSAGRAVAVLGNDANATESEGPESARWWAQSVAQFLGSPPALSGRPVPPILPPASILSLSAERSTLALAAPPVGRVQLFRLPALQPRAVPPSLGRATAVAFAPGGQQIWGWDQGRVRLIDLASGDPLVELAAGVENASIVAPSPDRRRVLVGTRFGASLLQFDLATMRLEHRYPRVLNDVAFTPDGAAAAFAGDAGSLDLIALESGKVLRTYTGLEDVVWCTAIDPAGERLAAGCEAGWFNVYELGRAAPAYRIECGAGGARDAGFARDGELLIVATGTTFEDADGAYDLDCYVRVFDAASGTELARSHDHERFVELLAVLPGDERVISLSAEAETWIWDLP